MYYNIVSLAERIQQQLHILAAMKGLLQKLTLVTVVSSTEIQQNNVTTLVFCWVHINTYMGISVYFSSKHGEELHLL